MFRYFFDRYFLEHKHEVIVMVISFAVGVLLLVVVEARNINLTNNELRILLLCGVGFIFGIGLFFWGFSRFRRKRLIENIPTSTIRAMALGLVEVVGRTKKKINLKSPLSETDCVFYRYIIEQRKGSGRSSRWVVISKGDSSCCPFYLDDGTGKVLVDPKDADLILPIDYEFETGWGRPLPDNLVRFMEKCGLRYKGLFGTYKLHFREWYILPDETIYILGTAKKSQDFLQQHNERLVKRLEELKKSPSKMTEIDLDKDGKISTEEWDLARNRIEQELLEEELKRYELSELADVVIGKGEVEKIFILSDHHPTELIDKLHWQSIWGIWGGASLALVSLLVQLGILF